METAIAGVVVPWYVQKSKAEISQQAWVTQVPGNNRRNWNLILKAVASSGLKQQNVMCFRENTLATVFRWAGLWAGVEREPVRGMSHRESLGYQRRDRGTGGGGWEEVDNVDRQNPQALSMVSWGGEGGAAVRLTVPGMGN